jgi:uncharacterized protein (UPF0335 family)
VLASNPNQRYEVKIRKIERLNNEILNGKLVGQLAYIHQAKKYSELRRKVLKSGIFKLEKLDKHKLFVSIDCHKLFEQAIEKNIFLEICSN